MPFKEFRSLKQNGAASAAELSEFLAQMRGKRPNEVLGLVANSGLTRAMVLATFLTVVSLGLLTVVPYGWGRMVADQGAPAPTANPEPAAQEPQQPEAPQAAQAEPTEPAAPAALAEQPAVPASQQEIMRKLGVGEARESDPLTNPLENRADDLLKDLK